MMEEKMNSFYFWDEMAAKCLKSERYQEAIQSYRHALEATDDNASQASVWANIGNIFLTIQDIPAAVDAFLSASRLDPASYDFDCILERITANGYLDEKAMLMAKDMYTIESVKTSQESEAILETSLDEVFASEQTNEVEAIASEPAVVEAAEQIEQPIAVADAEPVVNEPISSDEVNQPVAETVSAETPAEAEVIAPAGEEIAAPEAVIAEETNPEPEASVETDPVSSVETEPVVVEVVEPVVEEIVAPEAVIAEETNPEPEASVKTEPVSSVEIEPVVVEAAELVVEEIAAPEAVVAEETNPEPEAAVEAEPVSCVEIEPVAAPEAEPAKSYLLIPVTEIVKNPLHLRIEMKSDELVESVRQFGILQPLVVTRMDDGKYMVVTGNRRLEAARLAGLEYVPAVVRTANEREFLELALIENIQRVNLDPLELAEAYHLLIENFGLSADLIAASIGKSASVVTAAINLLKLTDEGKQALQERSISEGHARALVAIDLPALQNNALVYVLENRLGVHQTEDLVRIILNAVAVSRSYDESYREVVTETTDKTETTDETDETELAADVAETLKESELVANVADIQAVEIVAMTETTVTEFAEVEAVEPEAPVVETNVVVETSESEPVVVAEAAPAETLAEPEVVEAVAEESVPAVEQESVEADSAVVAEPVPDVAPIVEQPVAVMVSDDQLMDMLVAECEQAEAHMEENAAVENASVDFSWLQSEAEAKAETLAEEIHAPASAEFSVDEILEQTTSNVILAAVSVVAAVNSDAAQAVAVQTDVATEPVIQKTEENLADVIEEIVQFNPCSDFPVAETSAEEPADQTAVEPEPVASKEPEETESRAQLKGLEAIAVYKRVVENNPTNVRIWHLLGNLYSDMGQYEEAIDCMKRTVELDPGKYTFFYHLGLTLAIARRYPDAIQALEKTVELAPQHILAHCSLAGCYRRTGNETEAQKHIEIARPKLEQEKAYNRACFASITGNVDQAIELLQIALDTDKTPPEWLLRDPDLDFIRDDPRFEAMIAKLDIPGRGA
jgi:ParB family chromosome partitioning protein